MSVNQSNSPDDHKFSARKPTFDLSALSGEWHRGSAFLTAWENAFSMLFPLGEQSFINSVNLFKDQINDPKLLKEISDFQEQETVKGNFRLPGTRSCSPDAASKIQQASV